MMHDVNFADILLILLVCLVTFGILRLVHLGKTKIRKNEPPTAKPETAEQNKGTAEER